MHRAGHWLVFLDRHTIFEYTAQAMFGYLPTQYFQSDHIVQDLRHSRISWIGEAGEALKKMAIMFHD